MSIISILAITMIVTSSVMAPTSFTLIADMQKAFGTLLEERTTEDEAGQNGEGFLANGGVGDATGNSMLDSNILLLNDTSTKDASSNKDNPDNPENTSDKSIDTTTSEVTNTGQVSTDTTTKNKFTDLEEQSGPSIQDISDSQLADRLFPKLYPLFIQKIDGATLLKKLSPQDILQKLDGQQLLDKVLPYMDGQQLAEKVLPYLDIKPIVTHFKGESAKVKVSSAPYSSSGVHLRAECPSDQVPVSGDYYVSPSATPTWSTLMKDDIDGPKNGYMVSATFPKDGIADSAVECLTIEVGLKP